MGDLLLVRHGPGRGRPVPTLEHALDFLKSEQPELYQRVRIHSTGSGQAPDLEGIKAVWFWLGDPLKVFYPECYAEAQDMMVSAVTADRDIRFINDPDSLSRTEKSTQLSMLQAAGFRVARHAGFETQEELHAIAADFPFPAILRADQTHSLKGLHIVQDIDQLVAFARRKIELPGTLVEMIDTRQTPNGLNEHSIWTSLFHKKRVLVLGDRVDRRSVLFSKSPIVKLQTCTFKGPSRHLRCARLPNPFPVTGRQIRHPGGWRDQSVEADNHWWMEGGDDEDRLLEAARCLGLGCAALDYSTLPGGELIIWEANPYFYMPDEKQYLLASARMFKRRRQAAHEAFAGFIQALVDGD